MSVIRPLPDRPNAYGGRLTPLCALVSSMHPAHAGVQGGLVEELYRGGANPNGLDEDGLPLWTAITYGYPAAVDALARCGARVTTSCSPPRSAMCHGSGAISATAADRPTIGPAVSASARGPRLDLDHLLEYALVYSAGLGHQAVVELLLAEGPDLSVTEPVWHSTAAGAARYHHRHHILAVLEAT